MGYTISVLIDAELRTDIPSWLADYLGGLAGDDPSSTPAPAGEDSPQLDLPTGDWFTGTTIRWEQDPGGRWPPRFHLVGDFHDDFLQHQYDFIDLLGQYSATDGPYCACWNTMNHTSFTVFAARRGAVLLQEPAQPWQGETDLPLIDVFSDASHDGQGAMLQRLGASPGVLAVHAAAADPRVQRADQHPLLARYLLTRSVARVLRDHGAEAALEPLLEVLDAGVDPLAGPTAPGWRIGETQATYGTTRRAGLREVGGGLAEMGRALPGSVIDTGPVELEGGR